MEKNIVYIDKTIKSLIPMYLKNKQTELANMVGFTKEDNFDAVKVFAHKLKGSGAGYGFEFLSQVSELLEQAASEGDKSLALEHLNKLILYIDNLSIKYK